MRYRINILSEGVDFLILMQGWQTVLKLMEDCGMKTENQTLWTLYWRNWTITGWHNGTNILIVVGWPDWPKIEARFWIEKVYVGLLSIGKSDSSVCWFDLVLLFSIILQVNIFTSSNVVYSVVDSAVSTLWGQLFTRANTLLRPCSSWGSNSMMHKSNL